MIVAGRRIVCGVLVLAAAAGCGSGTKAALEANRRELIQLQQERDGLRVQLVRAEREARLLSSKVSKAESEMKRAMTALASSGVKVTPRGASVVLTMASRILFAPGETALQADARQHLVRVAKFINAEFPDRPVSVEGHTDATPPRRRAEEFETNWEISAARALSVLRCLAEDGEVAAERLSAAAFADTRPIADNDTAEGKAENRRVEIVVMPALETSQVSAAFE
jgi:chemotaxis protein MotB